MINELNRLQAGAEPDPIEFWKRRQYPIFLGGTLRATAIGVVVSVLRMLAKKWKGKKIGRFGAGDNLGVASLRATAMGVVVGVLRMLAKK